MLQPQRADHLAGWLPKALLEGLSIGTEEENGQLTYSDALPSSCTSSRQSCEDAKSLALGLRGAAEKTGTKSALRFA